MTRQEKIDLHDSTANGFSIKTVPLRQRNILRLAVLTAVSLGLSSIIYPGKAHADPDGNWFSNKRELTLKERRAQRRQFSDAFTARFGSEYQTNIPYVSQQAIDGLGQAIARYRKIVAAGGWRKFPNSMTIQPNDHGNHVAELRRHLALTGDLRVQSRRTRAFDSGLQEAVARFQLRHGLRITGFVGSRTRRALNVSARERLRQVETNLVRLRDLLKVNKAKRYVLVNVPSYTMQAVEGGTLGLQSKVIVGKPSRETPSVTARIHELNFFPYWRVPDSIAHKDLIPQIRKDPSYFTKENFSLLKGWGKSVV